MKVAVLIYRLGEHGDVEASLQFVDPFSQHVLKIIRVPISPNLGVFPQQDCLLVSYTQYPEESSSLDWLDVYSLSDWSLRARLPMDCRAHFNVCPSWCTFLPCKDNGLIYVYKTHSLGDHLAEDFISGLDLAAMKFTSWNFKIPECMAGWSACSGPAHAQMLFVADGLEVGELPNHDFEQKIGFWLGPDGGMGSTVSLGPRPRAHSDLGHARAILVAPRRPLSVVVCSDGVIHLIDPVEFCYLEKQKVKFAQGHAMPIFAAQIEPRGRFLYIGTATNGARHQGLIQRVVVHDLERGRWEDEWVLTNPLSHMALSKDGKHLLGAGFESKKLWVLDAQTGNAKAAMQLDGSPMYIIPAD